VAPSQQQPSGLNLPPGFQSQPAPAPAPAPPPPSVPQQPDPYDYQGSRPSQMNRPAEPLMNDPSAQQQPPQAFLQQGPPPPPPSFQQQQSPHSPPPPSFQQPSAPPMPQQPQQTGGGDDWMLSPPSQQPQAPQAPQQPLAQQQPQAFQQQMPQQYAQQPGPQQGQPGQPQGHPGPQQPPQYQTQAPAGWTAVIAPDREYFLAMMQRSGPDATGLNLPAYSPEQHLPLGGNQITIGRRRHSTGESPDIDLSVPPEDPGVSHQHAVLVQQPDGSWAVVDQNSTNGTTLNGAEEPIQPYVPIPLNDGDRVHVGAWTTITIRRG
jgi:hypothetical protein